jgi:double-stranded uracil-DNA glycosylase
LHESGLTPELLTPEQDARVLEFGIGLTDLAKDVAQSSGRGLPYDVDGFAVSIDRHQPRWLVFHGKEAAKPVARARRHGDVRLGHQPWIIGRSSFFVVPSASAANRDPRRLEGRSSRTEWYRELRHPS